MRVRCGILIVIVSLALGIAVSGQTDASAKAGEKGKKNARPGAAVSAEPHVAVDITVKAGPATHIYEFTRPGFSYSPVRIEHDDEGRGKIIFQKDGSDEVISDPLSLTPVTMSRLQEIFTALDFLNSSEDYQFENDYSHLGNVSITLRKDGRERTAKYNWTVNKHARELSEEYRRIANEYTWLFEFGVARVNQPLRTPGMMDALDGHLRRNEIPDPPHLLPFLTQLSTDERLPLMARNHALKLIKNIQKSKK